METLDEAIRRLRAAGYVTDFHAADGKLVCGECGEPIDPSTATVDEVVRYEGMSDPDDEAALYAILGPCGHRGLYLTAFGPDIDPRDVDVVVALARRH